MGDSNRLIALNHPVLQHLQQQQQQQQQQLRDSGKMDVEGNESSASAESDYEGVSKSDT